MPAVLHSELRIVPGLMAEWSFSEERPVDTSNGGLVDIETRLVSGGEEASGIDDICMYKIMRSCLGLGVYSCDRGSRES